MRKILLLSIWSLFSFYCAASNIKIDSEAKVVAIVGAAQDTAIVEFNLSWDNSWRDDFNWDATWIFLKYRKKGDAEIWHHAYLAQEGHEITVLTGNSGGSYSFMPGKIGAAATTKVTGLYFMPASTSFGNVRVKLRIKWPIKSNAKSLLTATDFGEDKNKIYLSAHALEMVNVPYGAYYLGDDHSNKRLEQKVTVIPAGDNLIGGSNYTYTASSVMNTSYPVNAALPAVGGFWWGQVAAGEEWWQVDFGVKKRIRSFSVGLAQYNILYGYLEGSNTGAEEDWRTLWSGGSACWAITGTYPIPQKFTVSNPGDYRFYRVRMKSSSYCCIYNIAMSENSYESSLVLIDSEAARTIGSVTLPIAYPQGYDGYYMMKYEVSQEQYVEFLNSLTISQQKSRVANNNFAAMKKGDYAFGDQKQPSNRNGIALMLYQGTKAPVLFGCNLNPNNEFYAEDDGQTLACNYLSPADMLAYCDWSGLRPMSELEYEKACRPPYPQLPEKGEYAWNKRSGLMPVSKSSDLTGAGTMREGIYNYRMNVNSGGKLNGPLRNGAFATSVTTQTDAGATYWGIMEMSGNLWEMCYNATATGSTFKATDVNYSQGDGYIIDAGTDITATYWPTSIAAFAVRGGSYATADSLLRTSDRTYAASNFFPALTTRKAEVGFRAVRNNVSVASFTPGKISCRNGGSSDTVCSGSFYSIQETVSGNAVGKITYSWYMSDDNAKSWSLLKGEIGPDLTYEFTNTTLTVKPLLFKRKEICILGEMFSDVVSVCVFPRPFDDLAQEVEDAGPTTLVATSWKGISGHWEIKEVSGRGLSAVTIDANGLLRGTENAIGRVMVELTFGDCSYLKEVRFRVGGVDIYDLTPGKYKVECWGAQGGRGTQDGVLRQYGGKGGYACGVLIVKEPLVLYAYIGNVGGDATNSGYAGGIGGRNGGGDGGTDQADNEAGGGGGGASDIRLVMGNLTSRIMVAGGGGGAVWQGVYNSDGGGLTTPDTQCAKGATQTSGNKFGEGGKGSLLTVTIGGYSGDIGGGGGGGGYYGGFGGPLVRASGDDWNKGYGTGGSGFISGHPGCNAVNASGVHTGQPNHYSGLIFTETSMQTGVKTGNGAVKITLIP